jgi:hypothetical protein
MSAIRPNREQFAELAASTDTGPVVMLNLLKFKAKATGEAGSGSDAYQRYGDQMLIGDPAQDWDSVVLVEYPSRKAFIEMVTAPKYEEAHEHREAGLERTVLVAMSEQFRSFGI